MTGASTIALRFYAELNDFLPPAKRRREYEREIFLSPAVKDIIEAEGVPHTEVDLVLVNGGSVGFDHRLEDGDRVAVYPVFEGLDIAPVQRLRPEPLREPRFVLDVHLGTLARRLRLLGLDTLYENDYADPEIIAISLREHRIILTRDLGILKHGEVTHGYYVRSPDPDRQVEEVIGRFHLEERLRPFTRCTVCNGPVETVPRAEVADLVEPETRRHYERFYRCRSCGKVYWEGSHYDHLRRWLATRDRGSPDEA